MVYIQFLANKPTCQVFALVYLIKKNTFHWFVNYLQSTCKPLAKGSWPLAKCFCVYYLLTHQLAKGLHWFTFQQNTCQGFVIYLQRTSEPLAKVFLPLVKDLALLAKHLHRIFTETCKQTNLKSV